MPDIKLNFRGDTPDETSTTLLGTDGVFTYPHAGRSDTDNAMADDLARAHPPAMGTVRDIARFNYRGAWVAGNYSVGEIVIHNGQLFLCITETGTEPPSSRWESMGTANIFVNADGDVGINGQPDTAAALTVHQDAAHNHILNLDASALTGADIAVRFLLSGTLDAEIKATATGNLELDADNDINFKTRNAIRWGIEEDGTWLPYGSVNIGTASNPVEHVYLNNLDGLEHLDLGGRSFQSNEERGLLTIWPTDTQRYSVEIMEDPYSPFRLGDELGDTMRGRMHWRLGVAAADAFDGVNAQNTVSGFHLHRNIVAGEPNPGRWDWTFNMFNQRGGIAFNVGAAGAVSRGWRMLPSGDLVPSSDSMLDIGSAAAHVRTLYADNLSGVFHWKHDGDVTQAWADRAEPLVAAHQDGNAFVIVGDDGYGIFSGDIGAGNLETLVATNLPPTPGEAVVWTTNQANDNLELHIIGDCQIFN